MCLIKISATTALSVANRSVAFRDPLFFLVLNIKCLGSPRTTSPGAAERLSADLDGVLDDIHKQTLRNGAIEGGIRTAQLTDAQQQLEFAIERKELNATRAEKTAGENKRNVSLAEQLTQGFDSITGADVVDKLVIEHVNEHDSQKYSSSSVMF